MLEVVFNRNELFTKMVKQIDKLADRVIALDNGIDELGKSKDVSSDFLDQRSFLLEHLDYNIPYSKINKKDADFYRVNSDLLRDKFGISPSESEKVIQSLKFFNPSDNEKFINQNI